MTKRIGVIRTVDEDGEVVEIEVELPSKSTDKKPTSPKKKKVSNDKSNKKQEEKQTTSVSKETISIKRTES